MNKRYGLFLILFLLGSMILPPVSSGQVITPVKGSTVSWPCSNEETGFKRYLRDNSYREMQTCDGTNWVPMGPHRSAQNIVAGCGVGLEGKQQYNATLNHMEYCDGINWYKIGCYDTAESCAGTLAGTQRFETNLKIMQYCDGTNWINMSSAPGMPCCPQNYVPVLADPDGRTTWDFCVAKYHMKPVHNGNDNREDGKGLGTAPPLYPESRPSDRPWGGVTFAFARAKCSALGESYHLMTNSEWMTIAKSIERNSANWSGGAVGQGHIPTGHSDGFLVPGQDYLAASSNDALGCFGTNNSDCLNRGSEDFWQKRTFILSNGKTIWDMAGNMNSWVDMLGPIQSGGTISYIRGAVTGVSMSIYQVNDLPSITTYGTINPLVYFNNYTPLGNKNAFLPANDYTLINPYYDQMGFGIIRWENNSGVAVFRGGKFDEPRSIHPDPAPDAYGRMFQQGVAERRGGLYSVWMWDPSASHGDLGFRCSYDPP